MKSIDLTNLEILKVIIHEVIRQHKHEEKTPPIYSEIESDLDMDLKLFFRTKITSTICYRGSASLGFLEKQLKTRI